MNISPVTIKSLLQTTPLEKVDAKILLGFLIDKHFHWPKSYLISHDQDPLPEFFLSDWYDIESQRRHGTPVAYLIGSRAFHQIDLKVTPDVLIPRPETELLVDLGIEVIHQFFQTTDHPFTPDNPLRILDLGSGSGAISLAVIKALQTAPYFPSLQFFASDVSLAALKIAKENAQCLGLLPFISFLQSNWFDSIPDLPFGVILSNPPYLAKDDPHLDQGDLRFEPQIALSDFADGLSAYRTIAQHAQHFLLAGGSLLFEHGFEQALAIQHILIHHSFVQIHTHQDYANLDRVTFGQKRLK